LSLSGDKKPGFSGRIGGKSAEKIRNECKSLIFNKN